MLRLDDVEAGIPLAQELEDKGIVLTAKVGPLASLVSELSVAVHSCGAMSGMMGDEYKNKLNEIIGVLHETSSSVTRVDGASLHDCSQHDIKSEDFAAMIATGVLATVSKAKTVVVPFIKRLEDAIANKLLSYEDRCISNIVIEEVGIDSILDNEEVFDFFSEFKEIRRIELQSTQFFPPLDDIKLAALVESGSPDINEFLSAKLMTSSASGTLGSFIYSHLYLGDGRNHHPLEIIELRNMIRDIYGDYCVLEGMMLAYYMGCGLLVNLPDGVSASIKDVEHRVGLLTKTIGMLIYGELKSHRDSISSKVLLPTGLPYVDSRSGDVNNNSKIIVNKEVYADFLANGGTPEVLFGAMVSDRVTNPAHLIEMSAKYEKSYADFVALNRSFTVSNKLNLYVEAIRDEVYEAFNDMEELKHIDKTSGVFLRLADRLKRIGGNDIKTADNIYSFLKGLSCNVLFPNDPNVEKVISDIDNYEPADGEESLSTSEVACFVLVDLMVDWLTDQIEVRVTQ